MTCDRRGTRELVHERVRRIAQSTPARIAVTDPTRSFSYGELEARANGLAHHLRALGVGRGSRVGVCHDRSATNVVGLLATLKAGAAYVGMDPAFPEARLEYMLRAASAPVLLTDAATVERLRIDRQRRSSISTSTPSWKSTSTSATGLVTATDAAYVMYTSGSSGRPNGVEISHGGLLHLVDWHNEAFGVSAEDRASVLANPAFDASVWEVWPYLSVGASLHVPDPDVVLAPEQLRDWLAAAGITVSFLPTPLAEGVLELSWPEPVPLRYLLTGGDVLHRRPAAETPFTLVNNYGVTEATVVSTSGVVRERRYRRSPEHRPCHRGYARSTSWIRTAVPSTAAVPASCTSAAPVWPSAMSTIPSSRPSASSRDPFQPDPEARMYRTGDLVRADTRRRVPIPRPAGFASADPRPARRAGRDRRRCRVAPERGALRGDQPRRPTPATNY